jgi:trimeric autotransporter adhesin
MSTPNSLATVVLAARNVLCRFPRKRSFILLMLALASPALLPALRAVIPAPDGGYDGGNTAEGRNALLSLTTGTNNTAIGDEALFSNKTGSFNTATGLSALHNTSGSFNTATGAAALVNNTTGAENTATGSTALATNTTGANNTANGASALYSNNGDNNTASGYKALFINMTGSYNTASGVSALSSSRSANYNTATGALALLNNTGAQNTATGTFALQTNNTGQNNTATGLQALFNNTGGSSNTADGMNALLKNTSGSNNIALGVSAGSNLTTGSNNIDIGAPGAAGESGKIRIGKQGTQNGTFIAGIAGTPISGSTVVVNSTGKLGVATSSARFKEAIKPMDKASEAILALKPVTFCYKEEIDPDNIPQFGLIAEEVQKVDPDLVVKDEDGKVSTVRYEAINAMLLNEFLKEHRMVEEQDRRLEKQESIIAQQQKDFRSTIAQQQKQIKALRVQLQHMSDRLEPNHAASKLANNQ